MVPAAASVPALSPARSSGLRVIDTMKNLTIRRQIMASFAVILALMMVRAAVEYTRLMRIEQLTSSIELEALPGLDYTHLIVVDRIANYSLTQQYVLETDMAMKQKLRSAILESRV